MKTIAHSLFPFFSNLIARTIDRIAILLDNAYYNLTRLLLIFY